MLDRGTARTIVHKPDQVLDRRRVSFEDGLYRAVVPVRDPAGETALSRALKHGVAEADSLHTALGYDAAPDHAAYSRAVEFRELLRRRRMVRAYEPEPIPRAAIERIVGTVRRAPSAGFSQGQRLIVVTEPETRRRIADLFDEEASVGEGREPWISAAPVLIVVCVREQDYHDRYTQPDKLQAGEEIVWPVPYWHFDAGAAAMLILLAAIDEGYAAGLFGVTVEAMATFNDLLGIPDDVAVTSCITVGKAADDHNWSAVSSRLTRRRKPVGDLVHWERWG